MKTCEVCGKEFMCFPDNCWCTDLNISKQDLKLLNLKYDNCLCPECIAKYDKSDGECDNLKM